MQKKRLKSNLDSATLNGKKKSSSNKKLKPIVQVSLILIILGGMFIGLYYLPKDKDITGFAIFSSNSQPDFSNGAYYQTFYNNSGFVQLNSTYTTGSYTSKIFDAGIPLQWNNLSWTEGGYYQQELPNSQRVETGLGGANMDENLLLYHLNNDSAFGENSTLFYDFSGNGNNASCSGNGCPTLVSGKFKNAYSFDGSHSVITRSTLVLGQSASFEAWAKYSSANPKMLWNHQCNAGSTYFDLWFTNNKVYMNTGDGSGNPFKYANGSDFNQEDISLDAWHHYVVVLDNIRNKALLYLDGNNVANASYKNPTSTNARVLSLGGPANYRWKGNIDEFAIYNRTLSRLEIRNHYVRGALRLNLMARSCNDPLCSGESWVDLNDTSPQNLSTNGISDNQYFQYKFDFKTNDVNYTPRLYNVSINYPDLIPPTINIISPSDYNVYYSNWIETNLSINEAGNCNYSLDNSSYLEMNIINNNHFYKNISNLTEGLHNIAFNCSDLAGNKNISLRHFTISFNPSCTNGLKDQDESDVDCGGICGSSCQDTKTCNTNSDCSSGFCEDDVCVSCSDGILNQGEDLVDCGGPHCNACQYLPYLYDDCGNSSNETHLIQGTDFTFIGGVNSSLPNAEKSVSYNSNKVIYRYPVDNMYNYQVKIKLLQPTSGERTESILADSNILDNSKSVPEYNPSQYVYNIPISSYANDSSFDLIFKNENSSNAICSEIEVWKSTSLSSSLRESSHIFDFNNPNDYIYNGSEIFVGNSSAKIYTNVEEGVWNTKNKTNFDEGYYNKIIYNETNSALQLNLSYKGGTYYSKILDSKGSSTWHNISWVQPIPYGQKLPNNKKVEYQWSRGNANMTNNVLLMHLDEAKGTIIDTSGEENNGTYNGGLYNQKGKLNTGIGFNGDYDLISVSENTPLNFTDNFSYGAWFKADSIPNYSGIISRESSWGNGYNLNLKSNGIFCGWGKYTGNFGAPSIDKWYHATCVYGNGTMKLYVNGILRGQDTGTMNAGNQNLKIGSFYSGGALKFNGTIDEVFVFNRTLSQQEISDIYKRGALKLNLSVRSCDDANCNTGTWVNVNGTSPQNLSVEDNRYFQYKTNFESYNKDYSPQLNNLSIAYSTNKSVNNSSIETKNLIVNNLIKWLNVSIDDSNEDVFSSESNESYDYASTQTGATATAQGRPGDLIDEIDTTSNYAHCSWPCNMTISFNKSAYINKIYTHLWDGSARHYNYSLYISEDGTNWTRVVNNKYSQGPQNDTFPATLTKYIKIEGLHNTANSAFHVIEMNAFEAKTEKEIKYFYSTDSGSNWNSLPSDGNISNLSVSNNNIKFKANISKNGLLQNIKVNYYTYASANCFDGIKNQDESYIDCGGSICSKCSNGKSCLTNSDCQSNSCSGGVCQNSAAGNNGRSSAGEGGNSAGGGIIESNQKIKEQENFTIKSIKEILPNKTIELLLDKKGISIDSIEVSTNTKANNVLFKIEELNYVPGNIPKLNNTYKSLRIIVDNLSDNIINKSVIKFNVNKSWMENNSFNSISLYRYHDNSWIKLKTEKSGEDNQSTYYEAQTPGFSYFTIVGEKRAKVKEDATSNPFVSIGKQEKDYLKWIILSLGILGLVGLFILKNHYIRNHFNPKKKEIVKNKTKLDKNTSIQGLIGKKVFTEEGIYVGLIKEALIDAKKSKIGSLLIEIKKKSDLYKSTKHKKGINLPYSEIKNVGNVVIVNHINEQKIHEHTISKK